MHTTEHETTATEKEPPINPALFVVDQCGHNFPPAVPAPWGSFVANCLDCGCDYDDRSNRCR